MEQSKREKILDLISQYTLITLSISITTIGVYFFKFPNNFVFGGVTGIAALVAKLTPLSASAFSSWSNFILLVFGWIFLGKKFAMTTIMSSFLYPIFLNFAQRTLGDYVITESNLLCALFGGMGLGIALGVVIRAGASTGGMDIPPLILKKLFGLPVPVTLWVFDFAIMLLQLLFHTPEDLLYGILMLLSINMTLNKTLVAGTGRAEVKIISQKATEIRDSILNNADRGVTMLHGQGGYLHGDCQVVLSVVATRELHRVSELARAVDPECFMVVTQVTEVWGRGFSFSRDQV